MWFIAKFCMFFLGGGMVKQKPNFFFFLFSFCFSYFPFGAVQSIPDSRSIDCAICNQFQLPGFAPKTSFSVPYHWDWESRIPICCFKPQQLLQQSHPSSDLQTCCRRRSSQSSSSPPRRPSSLQRAWRPSSPPPC